MGSTPTVPSGSMASMAARAVEVHEFAERLAKGDVKAVDVHPALTWRLMMRSFGSDGPKYTVDSLGLESG
jgi:hypothetical protein